MRRVTSLTVTFFLMVAPAAYAGQGGIGNAFSYAPPIVVPAGFGGAYILQFERANEVCGFVNDRTFPGRASRPSKEELRMIVEYKRHEQRLDRQLQAHSLPPSPELLAWGNHRQMEDGNQTYTSVCVFP